MDKTLDIELAAVRPKVLGLARKFIRASGLGVAAEDIAQEALVRLWTAKQDGADIRNVEAWAVTVTKNLCVSHLRKAAGRAVTSIPETISSQDSASAAIDAEDSQRIVAAALRQIPEGTRQLLQLRTAGMSLDEIAAVTGRSKGSVKSSISAARKQIVKALNEV